ncbi:MAG: MBL fold metallo-hydrolase [Clostridiales bacterium]|nr:MBL fold metallo-hydrolase [Candidatus Apopatocola equi]
MKVTFLGAQHEVTGSCTLLEAGGEYGLVDMGMEQGRDYYVNQELSVMPGAISFVLLTHAHVDHSGRLPLLYKNGFDGPIYATEETCNLARIMLLDCAHIQESDAEYENKKNKRAGRPLVEPLFDTKDAETAIEHLRPVPYGELLQISDCYSVRFSDVAHLLGSACIEVWLKEGDTEKKMVFSGDVGNINQPIIRNVPMTVAEADYVMVESTYGDRLHDRSHAPISVLAEYIQKTLDRGGNVIIPSFAVGRTQEMLYFIREIKEKGMVTGHDGFPVYVDSPMANEATAIYQQCDTGCLDDETRAMVEQGINPIWFDGLRMTLSSEDSKALNAEPTPKVIISASGMCDSGRIRHHLKHNLWRAESTVLFVGYQSEGTLGRKLYDGAETVKLFGEEIEVHAEIGLLPGKSGHADRDGLMNWLRGFEKAPKMIFVNHGEDSVTDSFAEYIMQNLGWNAFAPFSGTVFDLAEGCFVEAPEGIPIVKKSTQRSQGGSEAAELYTKLCAAGDSIARLIRESRGYSNKELRSLTKELENIFKRYR